MSRAIYHNLPTIGFFGLIAVALLVASASPAHAWSYWVVPTGDWTVTTNWNTSLDGSGLTGVPTDYAYIDNNGTCTITATDGGINLLNLYVGDTHGSGTLEMNGGSLHAPDGLVIVEQLGVAGGSGVFTQTGGLNCPFLGEGNEGYSQLLVGYTIGGYGEYDMGGGSLDVNAIFVAGNPDTRPRTARERSRKRADPSAHTAPPSARQTRPLASSSAAVGRSKPMAAAKPASAPIT